MKDSEKIADGLKILSEYEGEFSYSLNRGAIVYKIKGRVKDADVAELLFYSWDFDTLGENPVIFFYVRSE